MYIAISAGGVYRTDDGGRTWTAQNRGVRAMFMPNKYPEFGQCVHKIAMHPARPERLYLQNHWGLYRSDDNAENWKDIANLLRHAQRADLWFARWQRILDGLPSVVCIRNAVVEDASGESGSKSSKESRAISSPTKSATTRKSRPTKKG